jgi:hypothetical protein
MKLLPYEEDAGIMSPSDIFRGLPSAYEIILGFASSSVDLRHPD